MEMGTRGLSSERAWPADDFMEACKPHTVHPQRYLLGPLSGQGAALEVHQRSSSVHRSRAHCICR
jgi:hypothetical protein